MGWPMLPTLNFERNSKAEIQRGGTERCRCLALVRIQRSRNVSLFLFGQPQRTGLMLLINCSLRSQSIYAARQRHSTYHTLSQPNSTCLRFLKRHRERSVVVLGIGDMSSLVGTMYGTCYVAVLLHILIGCSTCRFQHWATGGEPRKRTRNDSDDMLLVGEKRMRHLRANHHLWDPIIC